MESQEMDQLIFKSFFTQYHLASPMLRTSDILYKILGLCVCVPWAESLENLHVGSYLP